MTVLLESCYEKDPDVVSREIAGEQILVPIRKKTADMAAIYVLNETGAHVWSLLDGVRSLSEVGAILAESYDVPSETVRADVVDLVGQLQELGMLRLCGHAL